MNNAELEYQLIANILSGSWHDVAHKFRLEYITDHQLLPIASTVIELDKEQKEINPVAVALKLGVKVGDILGYAKGTLHKRNTMQCLDHLIELHQRRVVFDTVTALGKELRSMRGTTQDLLTRAQQRMIEAMQDAGGVEIRTQRQACESYFEYRSRIESGDMPATIGFSMDKITERTGGIELGNLILLAARPSMGKTAFMLSEARYWAKHGNRGLIVSLEQKELPLTRRHVAALADIPIANLKKQMGDHFRAKEASALSALQELPLNNVDKRGLTVDQICNLARMEKHRYPDLKFIAVDHLTEIRMGSTGNMHHAIAETVKRLRDLAGELNVFILLLAQLNRGVESRENKRPMMSDLRESGAIEEHADMVIMLYRHGYYHEMFMQAEMGDWITEVLFPKNREGESGKGSIAMFKMPYMQFIECPEDWKQKYIDTITKGGK